nr:uncharacterized protein CTRU02_13708 [Colletotrichum truncatum]KAF6783056.1 hypothetical protein CTRU02_13708 [Colletotrichum truncatum]
MNVKEYRGGGTEYLNPGRETLIEAEQIWFNNPNMHPDVLVSVGSGYLGRPPTSSKVSEPGNEENEKTVEAEPSKLFSDLSKEHPCRYIRLPPQFLEGSPEADNESLSKRIKLAAKNPRLLISKRVQMKDIIRKKAKLIVHRLVSTTFYFEQTKAVMEEGEIVISGAIRCRYKNTLDITKAFGQKIKSYISPCFVVQPSNVEVWRFDQESGDRMHDKGLFFADVSFRLPASSTTIDIKFTAKNFPAESISGCPILVSKLKKDN